MLSLFKNRVVKEEISDDNARLPCFNGRVVSWNLDNETETDSVVSVQRERPRRKEGPEHAPRVNGMTKGDRRRELGGYESSSTLMSSELETTSFFDSDEDDSTSRLSSSTEQSSASRLMRRHKRRRRKQKSSSFSSITDSTMSLNIITVTLNMEKYNFLGISIVGQSNERGDGGIYIGSIMKGGAVAADGRIEPGDMLLQAHHVDSRQVLGSNSQGLLLVTQNSWSDTVIEIYRLVAPQRIWAGPDSPCSDPGEPIRPIDPAAWVSHTAAMTGTFPAYGMSPSMSTITSTSSSITSSIPETERLDDFHLSIHSDMATIVKAMASPESGLEVRSDVVDWLYHHVEGFTDRRESRKYASNLLKAGYIRHTVNKITFSEHGSERRKDRDPKAGESKSGGSGSESDHTSRSSIRRERAASECSVPASQRSHHSMAHSVRSHHSQQSYGPPGLPPLYSPPMLLMPPPPSTLGPPGAPPGRDLASVPPELTASRQSFRMAMGNPSEFFVDVM
ncbi:hypothetical protein Chor_014531 [Crotalus horridus]